MIEVWRDIPGYEGRYQISNKGLVKSFKGSTKILKPRPTGGYTSVQLSVDGVSKNYYIHQIVAMAFLNHKPDGFKLVIDHIDGCKSNNELSNLQIVTNRYNVSKGWSTKNKTSSYTGVFWHKTNKSWTARIWLKENGKRLQKDLGYFIDEESASKAYQDALKKYTNE